MAKKKKIDLPTQERHSGVILENIDSKLGLVVEGHKTLDGKIDKVGKDLKDFRNEVDFKFKVVQETLNSHTEILNSHTETLSSHTEMIAKNAENIEIIKSDINLIKNSIKSKVDFEEFKTLEKRVLLLEKKIARGRV